MLEVFFSPAPRHPLSCCDHRLKPSTSDVRVGRQRLFYFDGGRRDHLGVEYGVLLMFPQMTRLPRPRGRLVAYSSLPSYFQGDMQHRIPTRVVVVHIPSQAPYPHRVHFSNQESRLHLLERNHFFLLTQRVVAQ